MTDREAMKLALEALEMMWGGEPMGTKEQAAMQALRDRLAAPPPEPVAWMESPHGAIRANPKCAFKFPSQLPGWQIPLYAAPPDAEIETLRRDAERYKWLLNWLVKTGLLYSEWGRIDTTCRDWWILHKPKVIDGSSLIGHGETAHAAIDAAMQKGDKT